MPVVYKKPGDSFLVTGRVKNVGEVSIDLGLAPVLEGPKTFGLSVKWYGVIPVGGFASIYQSDVIPSTAPAGTYKLYFSAINKSTGAEFQKIYTNWDISVSAPPPPTPKIELESIYVTYKK